MRHYRYDASGQLTDINDTRRGQLAYRYDPVGRLLEAQSRLGHETFAFDPASNLIDPAEQREAERQRMPRIKALDNLLKQYAGTHYQYDARGNQTKRWKNGQESRFTWDLFDRLTHYEDERLQADYSYDALGRRLTKHSKAYYEERREAGPHWNRAERVKRNRELQCGFTLYGWDGDTLAWESKIADEDGFGARTTHYVYEPGSFVPVAQAVRDDAIELLDQPEYGDYYRQDEDPLWGPPPPAPPIDGLAWYQCDHLGTPQELTDEQSEIAWAAEYRAWGVAQEVIRKASGKASVANPIRFQGQYHDHETGLHYNRYRYYDPQSGRFVSKDPIGLAGGLNAFQYAPNPAGWIDPLSLAKTTCDLYAFGNASGPREPRIQGVNTKPGQNADLIADAAGMVGPTTEGGASTFGDVNKAPISGTYHKLPAGSELPDGIEVVADGKDVGGSHAATHHTVCPSKRMSGQTFVEKFKNLPWIKAGKK
ncbi:RHS domain-containing protein [Burkholderia cepacia]|nr:RHS repeat-associated core domain-containing protein [Burkholderia cepacia]MCA7939691.1 RHS domain-containing protein [Burkholderia cepacia]